MTPATKSLDRAGVAYRVHPYDHDESAESFGLEAAEVLGVDPPCVFKTLMAELPGTGPGAGELVVAIVPVHKQLALKALAAAAGAKKAAMADIRAAERSSGYVAGGISPFGQRARRRTFVDASALSFSEVYVSAGRRGLDLSLAPTDLIAVADATVAELTAQ